MGQLGKHVGFLRSLPSWPMLPSLFTASFMAFLNWTSQPALYALVGYLDALGFDSWLLVDAVSTQPLVFLPFCPESLENVILKVSCISTVDWHQWDRHCRLSEANILWMKAQKDPHLEAKVICYGLIASFLLFFCPPFLSHLWKGKFAVEVFGQASMYIVIQYQYIILVLLWLINYRHSPLIL